MNRTMVKVVCIANWFKIRTVRRGCESLDEIIVSRSVFEDLAAHGDAAQNTPDSFAVFERDDFRGTVSIRLVWLNRCGNKLSGWEENVVLNYEELMAFVRASAEPGGPQTWKGLSVFPRRTQPHLSFRCNERLRACLESKLVRHKLVKFLRDNFQWPRSERIEFYSDFVPYSFTFREIKNGEIALSGGLILHQQDDIEKALYSIHT